MNFKKMGTALALLAVATVAFGFMAQNQGSILPVQQEQHVLAGTTTPAGDFSSAENAPYYTIEVSYPATTTLRGGADAKARLVIETALKGRIDEFKTNGNFANLTPDDVRIQGLGSDRKYALDMQYKAYVSGKYVSFVYTIYEDTLGAHPNGYYTTFVFDVAGNQVGIKDVLSGNPNGLEELSLVASNQVTAELKKRLGTDDLTGAVFAEGLSPTVENYSNFYIDGDALAILFPPYQVAAYAAGSFEARVPLAEISK
jgi:hypothetical protein